MGKEGAAAVRTTLTVHPSWANCFEGSRPQNVNFLLFPHEFAAQYVIKCNRLRQPMPLNKYISVNKHLMLNACSMPKPSNEASCKLESSGRFSTPFYPFGRRHYAQSKGLLYFHFSGCPTSTEALPRL